MLYRTMRRLWVLSWLLWVGGLGWAAGQDTSATGAVLKGDYSTARAMDLLYSDFDADTKSAVWTPKRSPHFSSDWPDTVRVRVLSEGAYSDDGVQHHMLTTWAKPEEGGADEYSCHACGVLIGAANFRQVPGGWKVESSDLQLAQLGTWGKPPKFKVQRLGAHTWGLTGELGDMHQGEIEQALWIYGPKSGGFSQWFTAQFVDDDKYGEFPQDDWCKGHSGELNALCVWREIDYSMEQVPGKDVFELVKTRRTPTGVKRTVWQFDGSHFVKAPNELAVKSKPR